MRSRAAAALLLAGLACSPSGGGEGGAGAQAGDGAHAAREREPAPEFELPTLRGAPVRLSSLRGRTVVLDFWATWCPPCVHQVPELNRLWRRHRHGEEVAVFGVAVDVEGAPVVGPWVEEQGVEYPILLGDEALAHRFGVLGFPSVVVVSPDGRVDGLHVGVVEYADLEQMLASAAEPGGGA